MIIYPVGITHLSNSHGIGIYAIKEETVIYRYSGFEKPQPLEEVPIINELNEISEKIEKGFRTKCGHLFFFSEIVRTNI